MFNDIDQNTEEWLKLRAGKITGSGVSKIMANLGKAFSDPAKKYAATIALEQITGNPISSGFSNAHTDRGHEQEPLAREAYESKYFIDVSNGGFFDLGDRGCSPDGLVKDNGLIEIKSVINTTHYANIKRQSYDPAYKWQLLSNLMFTGREWIDFISYCADYPEANQLFICRIYAEDCTEDFKNINKRILDFNNLIYKCKQTIIQSNYSVGFNMEQ